MKVFDKIGAGFFAGNLTISRRIGGFFRIREILTGANREMKDYGN